MTHKPVQSNFGEWDFDGWDTDDAVGLVEYEVSEISEPREQNLASSGVQAVEKVALEPPQRLSFTSRRSRPSPQRFSAHRPPLGIDATAPGALAKPLPHGIEEEAAAEQYIDPFAPVPLEGWGKV